MDKPVLVVGRPVSPDIGGVKDFGITIFDHPFELMSRLGHFGNVFFPTVDGFVLTIRRSLELEGGYDQRQFWILKQCLFDGWHKKIFV